MAKPKTMPNDRAVSAFLDSVEDRQRQTDSKQLLKLMQSSTGAPPVMWGTSIIGFGKQRYKYASGREGETMAVGFAPRKQALTIYGLIYYDKNRAMARKLGSHTEGKGCLYVKKLSDIDLDILTQMIKKSFAENNNP